MKRLWPGRLGFDVKLRIPFGLRVFFRTAFALLALATLALALSVLVEEKRLSLRNYQNSFRTSLAQIATQLRHPTGQLALFNAQTATGNDKGLHPLVLPFGAIDFDDRSKVQQAVEMSGCQATWSDGSTLCVAVGNNPWAGGFIYLAGSLVTRDVLVARTVGDTDQTLAHRAQVEVQLQGQTWRWLAPFETVGDVGNQSLSGAPMVRGRLTGFAVDARGQIASRPVRDFRGWLWQDGRCVDDSAGDAPASGSGGATRPCAKRVFFSVRLPIDLWSEAIYTALVNKETPVWPPADLSRIAVHLQILPPGKGAALLDSQRPGVTHPFGLTDLRSQLNAGETLIIRKTLPGGKDGGEVLRLGAAATAEPHAPGWLGRLISWLPADSDASRNQAEARVDTGLGRFDLTLVGDGRSVNQALEAVAGRIIWFVAAMLAAIVLTWLAIELRIVRRITLLSKRAAAVSHTVRGTDEALPLDVSDLQSDDELGVLTSALADLLQRVNEDVRRAQVRAAQERDQWHAVGHEIMSPLQSLKALHGAPEDPSARYIQRMQQAIRVLYGSASPSEAFSATTLQSASIDLNEFLRQVAANAPAAGIANVQYQPEAQPVMVRADEHALEDAITHVLNNADRLRVAGSSIRLSLHTTESEARLHIDNDGPHIAPDLLDKIFGYGVSSASQATAGEPHHQRGQGLFVARTYLAKMGGTIHAQNLGSGVRLVLVLPRLPG